MPFRTVSPHANSGNQGRRQRWILCDCTGRIGTTCEKCSGRGWLRIEHVKGPAGKVKHPIMEAGE